MEDENIKLLNLLTELAEEVNYLNGKLNLVLNVVAASRKAGVPLELTSAEVLGMEAMRKAMKHRD